MSAWTPVGTWTLPSGNRVSVRTRQLPDGDWYGDAQWATHPSGDDVAYYSTVLWLEIFDRMVVLVGVEGGFMAPHP